MMLFSQGADIWLLIHIASYVIINLGWNRTNHKSTPTTQGDLMSRQILRPQIKQVCGHGGTLVVIILTFYLDDPSSNPAGY